MQVHRPLRIGAAAAAVAGAVVVDLQPRLQRQARLQHDVDAQGLAHEGVVAAGFHAHALVDLGPVAEALRQAQPAGDRKSTRLNSSPLMRISYAVFCLKKKKIKTKGHNKKTSNKCTASKTDSS